MAGWRVSAVEDSFPIFSERPDPDVFPGYAPLLVSVVASPALGGSPPEPAQSLVDGSGPGRVPDEGLDQHGPVASLPILGQATPDERGLSTTRGKFFSRRTGVHPMTLSRAAGFQAAGEKPSMATSRPLRS